jgi:hypothetical protein
LMVWSRDESESSILISEGTVVYRKEMGRDRQRSRKREVSVPWNNPPRRQLHYVWPRRKPHGLLGRRLEPMNGDHCIKSALVERVSRTN